MPLKCNEDGSYVANWVPSTSGSYIIQVFIDGKSAGTVLTCAHTPWTLYFVLCLYDLNS